MRIFFLVILLFYSNFALAKKDDIPEVYIDPFGVHSNNPDVCTINTSKGVFSFQVSESNDFKNSSLINSLELREQLLVEAIIKEIICQRTYGITDKEKEILLSSDYQDIVRLLLRLDYLPDQQIWTLWQEYREKHWNIGNRLNKCEQELKNSLSKRKKEKDKKRVQEQEIKKKAEQQQVRQQKEQEQRLQHEKQEKLVKKYNSKILNHWDDELDSEFNYISSYHQVRQQALQSTIADGGKQYLKNYEIDAQTQALMKMQGIDHKSLQSLSGTIFSHQLFQECADHYQKAAMVVFEYGLKNSVLVSHILEFTQTAFAGTQHEQFAVAVQMSNIAEILANSSVSICKGILRSPIELIDVALHAKQLAASLFKLTLNLGQILVAYDGIDGTNLIPTKIEQELADENAQIVHELCSISRNNFKDWCKNSREQEKLEEVSKLIADFTTTPFIFCKSLKGCSGILAEAKNAVNFQRAVELAEELGLGFQEAEELLVATEAGVQKLPASAIELETAVTSMMENEKQNILKQSSLSVDLKNSFEQVLDKLLTEGVSAADLSFQKEVLSYFNVMFRKPGYCVLDKQIETLFDKVSIVYHGKNKFLYCNPEHVLTPNLKFQLNKFTNLFEGRIYGSHYGRVTEYLEIQNLINVVEQYPLHNGRAIKYKHPFGNFLEIKTEFGSNLSQEQIMNNIIEVVQSENYLYQDRWFNGFKYKTHKIAVTKDGSIIEVFLLEQNADELFIETAYPYFEMFSKVKGLKWKP